MNPGFSALSSLDLDCSAKIAGIWNMPIISYTSALSNGADTEKFPTLVSVSTTTGNSLSDALVAIFYGFQWNRVEGISTDVLKYFLVRYHL